MVHEKFVLEKDNIIGHGRCCLSKKKKRKDIDEKTGYYDNKDL